MMKIYRLYLWEIVLLVGFMLAVGASIGFYAAAVIADERVKTFLQEQKP